MPPCHHPPRIRWRTLLLSSVLLLAGAGDPSPAADDGVRLAIRLGSSADEVRLDWTGGTPPFSVYRSTSPLNLVAAANKVGETANRAWLDFPPAAPILYYAVTSPCVPATEICDGRDNDCDGEVDEQCVAPCSGPADCAPEQFCDPSGECRPDMPDGGACDSFDQCASGHCQNGTCCAAGDCCASTADCDAYDRAPTCESAETCQGSRTDGICTATFQCSSAVAADDSGCAGLLSQDCGTYPSVICTGAVDQPVDQAALCATSCGTDADCDPAAHCDANLCVPDVDRGGVCDEASDCADGLPCVDGVCCDTLCDGVCRACDLAGTAGTCASVPIDLDPDSECGGVSCAGFYWGWSGDTCYRRADVSAAVAACNGSGACQTAAQECASSPQGTAAVTCNSLCQDPTSGTCTGTTAGTCTNVNPGNQTCGSGVCQVTVPTCVNGSPNTCVPNSGAATTEACNNIDDNCDGVIDNGNFSDGYEINNSCSSFRTFPAVGSNQTLQQSSLTVYPSGDVDYFRINANETDSSCGCCDFFCTDEDFRLSVTLSVPAGAGSYIFCTDTSCANVGVHCVNVVAGQNSTWTWTFDGACPGQDDYSLYVRVSPGNAPGYECTPYTLTYNFFTGCF